MSGHQATLKRLSEMPRVGEILETLTQVRGEPYAEKAARVGAILATLSQLQPLGLGRQIPGLVDIEESVRSHVLLLARDHLCIAKVDLIPLFEALHKDIADCRKSHPESQLGDPPKP